MFAKPLSTTETALVAGRRRWIGSALGLRGALFAVGALPAAGLSGLGFVAVKRSLGA